jgi:Domain of unknown function (DUF4365)
MDLNARKEDFSRAVIRAVAATAGVTASVPERDQDSVDITFAAPDAEDSPGARLDAQLKCSQNVILANGSFSFPLGVKNYDDLRWPSTTLYVPRILIVVHVPEDPLEWMTSDPEAMILKRCAYWVNLAGAPERENTSSVSVTIPTEHVFDAEALCRCLDTPGRML